MRKACAAVIAACFSTLVSAQEITPPPPAPPGASGAELLPALIEHSLHYATLEDGQLSGEGADFLRAIGENSQFVLLGEDHGNTGIASFATAYWRILNGVGYRYAAIEVDPYVAEAAVREMRAGGVSQWGRYLAAHGRAAGAPFLNWTPEAELVDQVVRLSGARRQPPIWGLDQVFNGSAPARFREIADGAHDRQARSIALELAQAGEANWTNDWFGAVNPERLQELRAHLNGARDRRFAQMTDAMIVSWRIYQPFMAGGGEAYLSNLERETLMKRTFQEHVEAATRSDGEMPRVMLKLGGYHVTRGATPTWVQGFGGFVSEYAVAHGVSATTVSMWCGPGGLVFSQPEPVRCDESVAAYWPFLANYIDRDRVTIIDFRIWRLRPGRWEHLSADVKALIGSYDILVFVPNGTASPFLSELADGPVQ